jgi:hypothetical protein
MSLSPTHTIYVICKYYWSTKQRDSYANEAHALHNDNKNAVAGWGYRVTRLSHFLAWPLHSRCWIRIDEGKLEFHLAGETIISLSFCRDLSLRLQPEARKFNCFVRRALSANHVTRCWISMARAPQPIYESNLPSLVNWRFLPPT